MRTRLTREESSRCKLTDDDIESIIRIRDTGVSYAKIAILFGVSYPTIYYYCNPEKRYENSKKHWEKRKADGYYIDKEVRKKLLIASSKTTKKKMAIIPGYSELLAQQSKMRAINRKYLTN